MAPKRARSSRLRMALPRYSENLYLAPQNVVSLGQIASTSVGASCMRYSPEVHDVLLAWRQSCWRASTVAPPVRHPVIITVSKTSDHLCLFYQRCIVLYTIACGLFRAEIRTTVFLSILFPPVSRSALQYARHTPQRHSYS